MFATKSNLLNHQKTHLSNNYSCPVKSSLHGEDFKSHTAVSFHIRASHYDGPALYESDDCAKTDFPFTTNTSASLRSHLIMCHTVDKKFICQYCGRGFLTKVNLEHHVTDIHKNPSSHHCHLCPRSLSTKSYLTKHIKRHERGSNFSCFVCQIDCQSEDELIRHTLTDPGHKENWGSERKSQPIEKESDYSPRLKLVLAANPESQFKKTCGVKGNGCVICQRVIPVDALFYQESFIPLSDNDTFDCLAENVIYVIVCTNPDCCPPQGEENCVIMFRYCGQTQFFLERMEYHFGENVSHNSVFEAHFKSCKKWFKIVPVAKTFNFQAARNFIEIDIISALKCCDTFVGGFNFLAGGQYNVKTEMTNTKDCQIQKKQKKLKKRIKNASGVQGTSTKRSAKVGGVERLSASSSSSSACSSSSDFSDDSDFI